MERPGPSEGEDLIIVWRDGLTDLRRPRTDLPKRRQRPRAGPVSVLAAIVDSLAPAPADDPRLTEHAFDEDTVAHP